MGLFFKPRLFYVKILKTVMTLSSKVNLHHAINFRALCGANLVT